MSRRTFCVKSLFHACVAGLLLVLSASASAQTKPVPVREGPFASSYVTYRQGVAVQAHVRFTHVTGKGLLAEAKDGEYFFVTPFAKEPMFHDIHNDFVAWVEQQGPGGAELYFRLDYHQWSRYNLSAQSPGTELHPAIYSAKWDPCGTPSEADIVWESSFSWGSEIMYVNHPAFTLSPVQIGKGRRPAISELLVAWEEDPYTLSYSLDRGAKVQSIYIWDGATWPAVGGKRIFFENLTNKTIEYVEIDDPTKFIEVKGPCQEHRRPKVNNDGRYVLFAGIGCPDGAQSLYLAAIGPKGDQEVYLVADRVNIDFSGEQMAQYDIDGASVAYLASLFPDFQLRPYWLTLDSSQLP